MLSGLDVQSETPVNLRLGNLSGYVRKHVDAALARGIHGNPGQQREFALYDFDSRKIHTIFGEGFVEDASVFVVASMPEPAGADAEAGNLRQIIRRDAAGVNFHARRVDFFFRSKQAWDDRKIIDGAASNSHHIYFRRHRLL